jgi:hypothetical protein
MALGLPFSHGEFHAYGATTGFTAVLRPLFSITIAPQRFLGFFGEFALAGLYRGWHQVLTVLDARRGVYRRLPGRLPWDRSDRRAGADSNGVNEPSWDFSGIADCQGSLARASSTERISSMQVGFQKTYFRPEACL